MPLRDEPCLGKNCADGEFSNNRDAFQPRGVYDQENLRLRAAAMSECSPGPHEERR